MTTVDRTSLVAQWERDYRASRRLPLSQRAAAEQALLTMAVSLQAAYEAGGDRYRSAMWQRRAWLLEHGHSGQVYDGTDPIQWQRRYNAGQVGSHVASRFLRRSSVTTAPDP